MTMPFERIDTLTNRVPDFFSWCYTVKSKDLTIKALKDHCRSAQKHYPHKYNLERYYLEPKHFPKAGEEDALLKRLKEVEREIRRKSEERDIIGDMMKKDA